MAKEIKPLEIGPKLFSGGQVVIDKNGKYTLIEPGEVELDSIFNSAISILGGVKYDVELEGPADNNQITIYGNVGDDVINDDGWNNDWNIKGPVGGTIEVNDSIGTCVSAWSASAVEATNSSQLEFILGWIDELEFWKTDNSVANIGWLEEGYVKGNSNEFNFGGVEEEFVIDGNGNDAFFGYAADAEISVKGNFNDIDVDYAPDVEIEVKSGYGNSATIDNADGAKIEIEKEAVATEVFDLGEGDTFVFDQGHNTKARLGNGNDKFEAAGTGQILANGDAGFDELEDNTNGDLVAKAFEHFSGENPQGHTTLLTTPVGGFQQFGESTLWLADMFAFFGEANEHGDAVVDYNGGSLTVIGAAEHYDLEMPLPADDWDFGGKG